MSTPYSMAMVVNNINLLTIVKPAFVFFYQVDTNAKNYAKEQLVLVNNQHNWQQIKPISRVMPEGNWVRIEFTDIPQSGNFDLLQDPNDGQPTYYIFDNVPFSELNKQTPNTVIMAEITEG
ncbi:MAG: hypothetical protein ACJAVX_003525 [Pseudoalteromonas rhizosphaerae]|jgi:hypothetical protein|uniref:Uncharacterized protein n=1 Tax=Pseudoalteromonas neustonica TaxID=1840331 RepID=A0ABY3F7Q3_9GAMM|nr:hypothetical protein [Pseudoalteromonas neustonica]TVU80031.1 hypothetical protein FQP85_21430 [Pseudoalteromonas neustonica]